MTRFDAAKKIISILRDNGYQALLAGGCVRDLLLGLAPKDFDVATDAPPDRVAQLFRSTKLVGAQFGVVIVRLGACETEVATFRSDGKYLDGRRPDSVQFSSAEEDALRRDFTINGMFLEPDSNKVVDFVGGQKDIAARLVRCIGQPEQRFAEDHLRMLRAIRFAARLGFTIHDKTYDAIRQLAPSICRISPERIRMELELILAHDSRANGWRMLVETGLHNHLFASVTTWDPQEADQVHRILTALSSRKVVPLPAAIAAMFCHHDASRAADACRLLRFSTDMINAVETTQKWASRWSGGANLELADLKLMRASLQYAAINALTGALIEARGESDAAFQEEARRAEAISEDQVAPPPLLRGEDLMDLGVQQGPRMGDILRRLYRRQLNEEVRNRKDAIEFVRSIIASEGES